MPALKIHFSTPTGAACGRVVRRIDTHIERVDCAPCLASEAGIVAKANHAAAKAEAFKAQEPKPVREPWKPTEMMVCKSCGNDKFREADRTCYGHYANWVCSACGNTESRLTETGMSF